MSSTRNTEALSNQAPGGGSGEFQARVQSDEPMMTGGHQPGKLVGNDTIPEFQAETLPPGSAPAARTFQPNNDPETAPGPSSTSALDDLSGATSADVHIGLGKPIQGQSSAEIRRDGQSHRKNPGTGGYEGLATQGQGTVDPRNPERAHQRAIDSEVAEGGQRGNVGGLPAQEREPEDAARVASERA